jgi:hypothetical protein
MVQPLTSPQDVPEARPAARQARSVFGIAAALVAIAVLGGAVVLWAHYGTAVFFELLAAGLQSCF